METLKMNRFGNDCALVLQYGMNTAVAESSLVFVEKLFYRTAQFRVFILSLQRLCLIEVAASGHEKPAKQSRQ